MADVIKVSGYHAADGSFHNTRKAAVAHSNSVKVMAALEAFVVSVENEQAPEDETLAGWLFRHRAAISAAYGQKAQLRAPNKGPKKPRKSKVTVNLLASNEPVVGKVA